MARNNRRKIGHLFIGGPLDGCWQDVAQPDKIQHSAHFPSWNQQAVNPNDPVVVGTQVWRYKPQRLRDENGKPYIVFVCEDTDTTPILERLLLKYPKKRKKIWRIKHSEMQKAIAQMAGRVWPSSKQDYIDALRTPCIPDRYIYESIN